MLLVNAVAKGVVAVILIRRLIAAMLAKGMMRRVNAVEKAVTAKFLRKE